MDALDANLEKIGLLGPQVGRVLSLVDLIKLGTMPLNLAAYLMSEIRDGASVLVGARAGRAGKTTLMGALLGVIPSSDRIVVIEHAGMMKGLKRGTRRSPKTYVVHEISNHGPRHGPYLWGPAAVDATRLVGPYTRLVSSLHADTIKEVRAAFRTCGSVEAMNVFDSIVFIKRFRHGSRRVVDNVWRFDASSKSFELAYSGAEGFSSALDGHLESRKKELAEWETFLKRCIRQGISAIEDVAYALREYSSSREVKAEYAEPLS